MHIIKRAVNTIVYTVEFVNRLLVLVSGLTIFGIFLVISQDVIRRELLYQRTIYGVDLPTLLLPGIPYLALAYLAQIDGHVRVDLLVSRLSLRNRAISRLFSNLLFLIFALIIVLQGWENLITLYSAGSYYSGAERLFRWPFAVAIPVGGFFLCLQVIILLGRDVAQIANANTNRGGR